MDDLDGCCYVRFLIGDEVGPVVKVPGVADAAVIGIDIISHGGAAVIIGEAGVHAVILALEPFRHVDLRRPAALERRPGAVRAGEHRADFDITIGIIEFPLRINHALRVGLGRAIGGGKTARAHAEHEVAAVEIGIRGDDGGGING